jgi:hypothetical protein
MTVTHDTPAPNGGTRRTARSNRFIPSPTPCQLEPRSSAGKSLVEVFEPARILEVTHKPLIVRRAIRAVLLDASLYEEGQADPKSIDRATIVILIFLARSPPLPSPPGTGLAVGRMKSRSDPVLREDPSCVARTS